MRTKEDERKLVDTFDQTTVSIKSESRPLFAELIKATEEYQKTLAQTAFAGNKLAEVMKRVVAISPDPEMNRGLEDVAEIVGTHEKQNDDFSRFVLESIVLPMRMHQDDEKKTLPEFIKNAKAQRKASKKVCGASLSIYKQTHTLSSDFLSSFGHEHRRCKMRKRRRRRPGRKAGRSCRTRSRS